MHWFILTLAVLASSAEAAIKSFQWDMSYINASPDGVSRPVIAINGVWPPAPVWVDKGDDIVINVVNHLNDGEYVSLHTHGIFQNGTTYYDGVPAVSQWYDFSEHTDDSAIAPGYSFTYEFGLGEQTGTYWIHSHIKGQYPNGLRAPFIIRDPDTPYKYDDEIVLSVSDWVSLL